MTVVLAILGALVGGVAGAFIGFFAVIALGTLTGADNQQGALAMGAAVTGAPFGALIGAVLGCLLVIRLRRNADLSTQEPGGQRGMSLQGWVALAIVAAALSSGYWYLFYEPRHPTLPAGVPRPVLHVEIRVPLAETDLENFSYFRPDLRTFNDYYFGPDQSSGPTPEGDQVFWRAQYRLTYDYKDRAIHLWVRPKRLLIFDLNLPGNPPHEAAFSDWRVPTHVREDSLGQDLPGPHSSFIRTRVTRPAR